MASANPDRGAPIILYDGVCHLCARSVRFVLRHERGRRFQFCWLQSETGRALLRAHDLPEEDWDSVVLIEEGRAYLRSDAALRISSGLQSPWSWLIVLRVVPRPIRDGVYRWIARHRYGWFGRDDACLVPSGELRDRFMG